MTGYWVGWAAGSWGASWGDIPVDETWNTSQGVARNLANNIKWEPVHDAEQVLFPQKCRTLCGEVSFSADSTATLTLQRANTTTRAFYDFSANGYATLEAVRAATEYGPVDACADSGWSFGPLLCSTTYSEAEALGGCEVELHGVAAYTTTKNNLHAQGVANPSDEEMVVLVTQLLTRRKQAGIRQQWK